MRWIVFLAGAALLAWCAGGAVAQPQQLHVPLVPLRTGIAYTAADAAHEDLALERVRAAGATTYRLTLDWASVAPKTRPASFDATDPDDPGYDWTSFDTQLQRVVDAHLTPLVAIYGAPSWGAVQGAPAGADAAPLPSALHDFALAAARRYDGAGGEPAVRQWLVWLEPNINVRFWPEFHGQSAVGPVAYRAVVNAMASAIHAANPANLVIAGGLSPFTVSSGPTRTVGPLAFMRAFLCMSGGTRPHATCASKTQFDVWSHDPYTSGGPTHHAFNPDDVSLGDLAKMRALLYAAVAAHHVVSKHPVKFWVTEFSWDSNPPDRLALPLALQARWTAEALYRMWSIGIEEVMWLSLRDNPYPSDPVQAGLYFRGRPTTADDATAPVSSDRAKPVLTAFHFPFVAYTRPDGTFVWGRRPASDAGAVTIQARAGTRWTTLGVVRANRFGIFEGLFRAEPRSADLRAVEGGAPSLPFSLTVPPDRFVRPFG